MMAIPVVGKQKTHFSLLKRTLASLIQERKPSPEPEIIDKDAVHTPKIKAITQELEVMMKERESKDVV